MPLLGRHLLFRPRQPGAAGLAAKLALISLLVPMPVYTGLPPGTPVGCIALAASLEHPGTMPLVLGGSAALLVPVWLSWFLFLRSSNWLRLLTLPLAVVITAWPLWAPVVSRAPAEAEISAQRLPERGDWFEVCTIQGYRLSGPTSASALERGHVWLQDRDGFYLLDPKTCRAEPAGWVESGSRLLDVAADGRAISSHHGKMVVSGADFREALLEPAPAHWPEQPIFSTGGEAVAWLEPAVVEGSRQSRVASRMIGAADVAYTPLELSGRAPESVRLLRYDVTSGRAKLALDNEQVAVVGRAGDAIESATGPPGCWFRGRGSFQSHPRGWLYWRVHSSGDCQVQWLLGGQEGRWDQDLLVGPLSSGHTRVVAAALDPTGRYLSLVTQLAEWHHSVGYGSYVVIRTDTGEAVFRRHVANGGGYWSSHQMVVSFAGAGHAVLAEGSTIRVFRISADLP